MSLHEIRALSRETSRLICRRLKDICAATGVAVVLVPEIKGARASGATRWLTAEKAMLLLSFRYKRDDHFWFSFFHEAGHILRGGKKDFFIEHQGSEVNDAREAEANRFAEEFLISRERASELPRLRSLRAVQAFASSLGIAPGIVVGRMQREGLIRFNRFNSLKLRLDWDACSK